VYLRNIKSVGKYAALVRIGVRMWVYLLTVCRNFTQCVKCAWWNRQRLPLTGCQWACVDAAERHVINIMHSDVSRARFCSSVQWFLVVCDAAFTYGWQRSLGGGQAQSPDGTDLLWRVTTSRDIDYVTLRSHSISSRRRQLSTDDLATACFDAFGCRMRVSCVSDDTLSDVNSLSARLAQVD